MNDTRHIITNIAIDLFAWGGAAFLAFQGVEILIRLWSTT